MYLPEERVIKMANYRITERLRSKNDKIVIEDFTTPMYYDFDTAYLDKLVNTGFLLKNGYEYSLNVDRTFNEVLVTQEENKRKEEEKKARRGL